MQASWVSQSVTLTHAAKSRRAARVAALHALTQGAAEGMHSKNAKSLQMPKQVMRLSSQSAGQSVALSSGAHAPSPHTEGGAQSAGHVLGVSVPLHAPSPHTEGGAQSAGHVLGVSVPLHAPSPHTGRAVQSAGHVLGVSVPLHAPSPHTGRAVQSAGHVLGVSVPLHAPSPHTGPVGQSAAQLSPASQRPSPQRSHGAHAPTASPAARAQSSSPGQFASLVQPALQVSITVSQYCPAGQLPEMLVAHSVVPVRPATTQLATEAASLRGPASPSGPMGFG
jgi:hypothetical protein